MIEVTLDKALEEAGMSRYELSKRTGIQYQVIDNYYKNRVKRYDGYVLNRICDTLDCPIGAILKFTPDQTD